MNTDAETLALGAAGKCYGDTQEDKVTIKNLCCLTELLEVARAAEKCDAFRASCQMQSEQDLRDALTKLRKKLARIKEVEG